MIAPEFLRPQHLAGLLVERLQSSSDAGGEDAIADDQRRRVGTVAHLLRRVALERHRRSRLPTSSCPFPRSRRSPLLREACRTSCRARRSSPTATNSLRRARASTRRAGRRPARCRADRSPRSGNSGADLPTASTTWRGRRCDCRASTMRVSTGAASVMLEKVLRSITTSSVWQTSRPERSDRSD